MEVTSIGSKHPVRNMKIAAGALNAVTNMLLTIATGMNMDFLINMMKILHMNAPMGALLLDLKHIGMTTTKIGDGILAAAV